MNFYKDRHLENNQLLEQHERAIDNIQNAIKREIPHLIHELQLATEEADSLNEYVNDRLTLFRFLRKNNYSLPTTLSLLLDTIRWRIAEGVNEIRTCQLIEFLSQPLVYFHKTDRVGRPILIVQLAHLPKPSSEDDITEFYTPLVIFVLETIRLHLWHLTQERIESQFQEPAILDAVVLVDFKNTSSLPNDINLYKSLINLVRRFPGMVGTVNLINFGWMYQGLWQMCKLVLSNEAKAKIKFPKLKELEEYIDEQDLLQVFGGKDDFVWNLSHDEYYNKYRPSFDRQLSRRSSCSSIYYDSINMTHVTRPSSSFSIYTTPLDSLTPVHSHSNLTTIAKAYSSLSLSSKLGNNMPPRLRTTIKQLGGFLSAQHSSSDVHQDFLAFGLLSEKLSKVQKQQEEQNKTFKEERAVSPFASASSDRRKGWLFRLVLRFQYTLQHITFRFLKKMIRYQRTVYWVAACVLLRNGVHELVQQLSLMMLETLFASKKTSSLGINTVLRIGNSQMTL
ncbi:CRAL-TRIO domain-containing protein [Choanephora cucurbitarum]|nr:CRAL-TRIO domain-containing protein [Choanephora cucurbitarum]